MIYITYNKEYATKYMTLKKGRRYFGSEFSRINNLNDLSYYITLVMNKIENSLADEKENVLVVMNEPVISVIPSTDFYGGEGGGNISVSSGDNKYLVTITYEAILLGNIIPE